MKKTTALVGFKRHVMPLKRSFRLSCTCQVRTAHKEVNVSKIALCDFLMQQITTLTFTKHQNNLCTENHLFSPNRTKDKGLSRENEELKGFCIVVTSPKSVLDKVWLSAAR